MTDPDLTSDLFDRHGGFVRSLARELTACEADADDLAQETWVEALRRPPRQWVSPRGWLSRVTRRLAYKRVRGVSRRRVREAAVALPERLDAAPDQALVLQDLVEALLTLDADLRRLVTARHFEGLELRAIARREGLGLTSVKRRLARAHALLRARLDARHDGDRDRWLGALLPFALRPTPAPLPDSPGPAPAPVGGAPVISLATGALLVSAPLKLCLAAAVCLAAFLALTQQEDAEAHGIAPATPVVEHATDVAVDLGQDRVATRQAAGVAPEEAAPGASSVNVQSATLLVRATDLDGVPANDVEVFAAHPGEPLNQLGSTDHNGQLLFSWDPGLQRELVFALRSKGEWLGGLRRLPIRAARATQLRVCVHPSLLPRPSVRFGAVSSVNMVLAAHEGAVLNRLLTPSSGSNFTVLTSHGTLVAGETLIGLEVEGGAPAELRRGGLLGDPVTLGTERRPRQALSGFGKSQSRFSLSMGSFRVLMDYALPDPEGESISLTGLVQDQAGLPAAHVRIRATGLGPGTQDAQTLTDPEGRYKLELAPGNYQLTAGAPKRGGAEHRLEVAEGQQPSWDAFIDRGLAFVGDVRIPGHESEVPVLVEASASTDDGFWLAVVPCEEEGRFQIPHCPSLTVAVDLSHRDLGNGLPLAQHSGVTVGGTAWSVELEPQLVSVSGAPVDDTPGVLRAGEVRVWGPEGRRGSQVQLHGEVGSPFELQVPRGSWTLQLGLAGLGWPAPIPLHLPDSVPLDLGAMALPPVGLLELDSTAEGSHWRVLRRGRGSSELVCHLGVGGEEDTLDSVPLPPGSYEVELVTEVEGEAPQVEPHGSVEVQVGRTTRLDAEAAR